MKANFEIWDCERGLMVSIGPDLDKVYISLLTIEEPDDVKEDHHPIESFIIKCGASDETFDLIDSVNRFTLFFAKYNQKELLKFFEMIVDFLKKNITGVDEELNPYDLIPRKD